MKMKDGANWTVLHRDQTAGSGNDRIHEEHFETESAVWDFLTELTGQEIRSVDAAEQYQIDNPGGSAIDIASPSRWISTGIPDEDSEEYYREKSEQEDK